MAKTTKRLPVGWSISEVESNREGPVQVTLSGPEGKTATLGGTGEGMPEGYTVADTVFDWRHGRTLEVLVVRGPNGETDFYPEGTEAEAVTEARSDRVTEALRAFDILVGLPTDAPAWERGVFEDIVRRELDALRKADPRS